LNVFEVLAKGHRRIVTNMAGDTIWDNRWRQDSKSELDWLGDQFWKFQSGRIFRDISK
jgi:hypothetical protein